ncbi:MAG: Negative regulator of tic competence ClpC/MecB [Candidatus Eremiobacteraeota bacterium]|nr:Negative regulator of tic competence ClpC/MecB [Candidatus Eremiobacteraeota bacterium]
MSTWEPFTADARHAMVRAQEVAVLFGGSSVGTEHVLFALADGDDPLAALLAGALDRDAIRARLGVVSGAPGAELQFSDGAKRTVALAFANARRLGHHFIAPAHLALGALEAEPPPLAGAVSAAEVRNAVERLTQDDGSGEPGGTREEPAP